MGQLENISYNSEFHAQKQSSRNWILMIACVHETLSCN